MKVLWLITLLFSGLVAGLFYSYSCSVNPGLKMLKDSGYLKAMQSINIAIQNPVFFITFVGLVILLPITAYKLYQQPGDGFILFMIATVVYVIGVFGLTMFCNVPLNNRLAAFSIDTASETDLAAMRHIFEKPWNSYHTIRTISAIASFALLIVCTFKQKF
jgi:uncharacterized membrane protein